MRIEEEIFKGYEVNKASLEPFGFIRKINTYYKEYSLKTGSFRANIEIKDNEANGKIIDTNFDEEFTLFRNEHAVGEFLGHLKEEYKTILLEIRDHCFNKVEFLSPQANRVKDYIYLTYQDKPDFPWDRYPHFGVFRNKDNNRWYGIIMDVEDNKLGDNVSKRSVINIKPSKEKYAELINIEGIYPGWHMNKKSWLSISLNDTFNDEYIFSLIDHSYNEVKDKEVVRVFPPKKKGKK